MWQSTGGPTLLWNGVARDLVDDPSYGVDLDDSALLFGDAEPGGADAAINCWNDKYHWDFWRPWQAIHEADRDGNPATEPDPSWTPLLTAPYPDHPSGHLCLDGAHLRVLQIVLRHGRDRGSSVTSSRFGGETRYFDRFSEPLKEIIEARIWAGLHYRTADVQAAESRREGRRLHGGELLPAAGLTPSGGGPYQRPSALAHSITSSPSGVETAAHGCRPCQERPTDSCAADSRTQTTSKAVDRPLKPLRVNAPTASTSTSVSTSA